MKLNTECIKPRRGRSGYADQLTVSRRRVGKLILKKIARLDIPLSILQEKQISLQENNTKQSNYEKDDLESNEINVRETRILFDEIGNLYNRYEIAEQQKQSLLLQREKDIEKAVN